MVFHDDFRDICCECLCFGVGLGGPRFLQTASAHYRMSSAKASFLVDDHQFKLVCDHCGSLTIVLPRATDFDPFVVLKCGRCESPRGTLQALRRISSLGGHYLDAQISGMRGKTDT
jgi:hypothetical protein